MPRRQRPSTPLSWRLRGELTGSRWKVRYAAASRRFAPGSGRRRPFPMVPPFSATRGGGDSAGFTEVGYGSRFGGLLRQTVWAGARRKLGSRPVDLGLKDRVALVTAASKGLGFGIARALAEEGARVAISSRSADRIEAAADQIGARGYVHDSADLDAAPGLIDTVETDLGPLDVLVTNTRRPPARRGRRSGFSREQWEAAYRELVLAPIALIERALPGMRERGFGRVLSVASSTVREPAPVLMLSNAHRVRPRSGIQDDRPRGGVRRRHAQLDPARTLRHRPAGRHLRLARGGRARRRGHRPRRTAGHDRGVRRSGRVPLLRAGELRDGHGGARRRRR